MKTGKPGRSRGGKPGRRWRNVKPCPSEAAYKRHIRHGEVPCEGDYAEVNRICAERRARRKDMA